MDPQYADSGVTGPMATGREGVMAEDGPVSAGGSGWGLPQLPLGWGEGCYSLGTARDTGVQAATEVEGLPGLRDGAVPFSRRSLRVGTQTLGGELAGQGGYVGYAPDEYGE